MNHHLELSEDSCRDALTSVLASETLRHSDQLRKILQYVCEAAIEGRGGEVTENAIAIDVLNRLPSYTPTDDSSVRTRVYTLRKKLAHYYEVENPSVPVCIEIPKGGYIPRFYLRETPRNLRKVFHERSRFWITAVAIIAGIMLAGVLWVRIYQSNMMGVWAPLIDSGKGPVLIVVGAGRFAPTIDEVHDPQAASLPVPANYSTYRVERVGTGDARALFHLGVLFGRLNIASEVRLSSRTSFEDLHSSRIVLLSAFNNQFTLKATSNLRYHFERYDIFSGEIVDSKHPSQHWHLDVGPSGQVLSDYGIAVRLLGQGTSKPMVIAAGLEQCGTEASITTLTDGQEQLISKLPAGWQHHNFEALVGVNVVDGTCGAPSILRVEVW